MNCLRNQNGRSIAGKKLFERYVVLTLKGGRRSISIFNGELEQLC